MKRSLIVIAVLMVGMTVPAFARQPENNVIYGMAEKGVHGLVNIATGWFELPMQIYKGYEEGIPGIEAPAATRSLGAGVGVVRGLFHAVGRTAWGVIQLGGFWTSNPTDNKAYVPLLDAEYSWQMGTRKTVVTPDLDASIDKMAARVERGLKNVFCGVAELPGQVYKADMERRVYIGVVKGLWFTLSREIYGAADVALFLFPMPEENLGVPFDEVEPWDALWGNYYNNVR